MHKPSLVSSLFSPIHYRKYTVVWFWNPEGVECSYRFRREEASERTQKLLKRGFTVKCDPFERKELRLIVPTPPTEASDASNIL
jgi:hypothetical protein